MQSNQVLHSSGFPVLIQLHSGLRIPFSDVRRTYRDVEQETGKVIKIGCWGGDILEQLTVIPEELATDVVCLRVSNDGLGFNRPASYQETLEAASSRGLFPCTRWFPLFLRIGYLHQPRDERIMMAMQPVVDKEKNQGVFLLECDKTGVLTLHGNRGDLSFYWPPETEWMFLVGQ